MRKTSHYFRLPEANELKQTYSSWIGKKAYVGGGKMETLKDIIIKPSKDIIVFGKSEKGHAVYFEFENKKRLSAYSFLIVNGLTPVFTISSRKVSDEGESQQTG
ncbi:MAG: hypothetical protein ACXVPQ_11075 [Bacteroidia bacterium]